VARECEARVHLYQDATIGPGEQNSAATRARGCFWSAFRSCENV
jgi:hypothetical protein